MPMPHSPAMAYADAQENRMSVLVIGLILFLGVHVVPTVPAGRAALFARLGEGGYKGAFSVLSLVGLVLIGWGLDLATQSPANIQFWSPPVWTKHLSFALMPFAFILLAAAYIPSHIHDRAKHPMLAGIKIWAFAHLLANGNLVGLLFFGSFLAYAVYDRISVKKRNAPGPLAGKHGGWGGDAAAIAVGLALYAFMLLWGHRVLIGISLVG